MKTKHPTPLNTTTKAMMSRTIGTTTVYDMIDDSVSVLEARGSLIRVRVRVSRTIGTTTVYDI